MSATSGLTEAPVVGSGDGVGGRGTGGGVGGVPGMIFRARTNGLRMLVVAESIAAKREPVLNMSPATCC